MVGPLNWVDLDHLSDAILEIWQPGIAGGSAVAGIISGRLILPENWPLPFR